MDIEEEEEEDMGGFDTSLLDTGDHDVLTYMDEGFEEAWQEIDPDSEPIDTDAPTHGMSKEQLEHVPPGYGATNTIAKHKHLVQLMALYAHAQYGEPMGDLFEQLDDNEFITERNESVEISTQTKKILKIN